MKIACIVLALAIAGPAAAQEKKAPARKPVAKQAAHKKPTTQQIRKFEDLQKKRQAEKKK